MRSSVIAALAALPLMTLGAVQASAGGWDCNRGARYYAPPAYSYYAPPAYSYYQPSYAYYQPRVYVRPVPPVAFYSPPAYYGARYSDWGWGRRGGIGIGIGW